VARRRSHQAEELPDLTGRQAGRFPEQWSQIDQRELEHRHRQAALLVAKGYGAVRWGRHCGSSTGSLFDDF
jgi:hypothetical protein